MNLTLVNNEVTMAVIAKYFVGSAPKKISLATNPTDRGYHARFEVISEYGFVSMALHDNESKTEAQLIRTFLRLIGETLEQKKNKARKDAGPSGLSF